MRDIKQILDERLAKGEITVDEYKKILQTIRNQDSFENVDNKESLNTTKNKNFEQETASNLESKDKNSSLVGHNTQDFSQKKLTFTKAVVVEGKLTNISNTNFSICKINFEAYKVSGNSIKDYIYKFKPLKRMSILKYDIAKGQTIDVKAILEPFTYTKDYNVSIKASCR